MKAQLFIDSLRAIITTFEACTLKIINRNSPLSHKIQDLSLNLLSFKTDLLGNLCNLFKQGENKQIYNKLSQQAVENKEKLKRLELHALLRKKINRLKKQSMMNSIVQQSFSNSFVEDPTISKLRNSMVLIEKDLGINEESDKYEEEVSGIVHKSMASLEMTPIKNNALADMSDTSMRIEDQYVLPENYDKNIAQSRVEEGKKQQIKTQTKGTASKLPNKKKKTTIYSNKGGMLDNLLQQSLQSYMSGPQKV